VKQALPSITEGHEPADLALRPLTGGVRSLGISCKQGGALVPNTGRAAHSHLGEGPRCGPQQAEFVLSCMHA